ncbi:hypothetical protein H6F43_20980 [Leptolyngbya sp. FACHB-36]|uniref:hypothetical protein n=1 Tax=Leptolyngbya sp. FACHB-36 TaxID=2692808 RepID=UPI00168120AA|nr:hypothetical protein [Leptolyngbya sp. FACHB-36]MBD2022661.1 hypothetical protein [Leptolyngbya sp. FACHB-36]
MALSQSQGFRNVYYILMVKSFLIWTLTLAVCLLIVGFPIIILMMAIGSALAVILQSIMPVSAVLVVASSLLGMNLFGILFGAAALTLKGIHPHDVTWLRWLHGQENPRHNSVNAACPLTCSIRP